MPAHSGELDKTLGALTLTGAGLSPYVANLSVTLGALTLTGAGDSPAVGVETPGLLGALTLLGRGSAHLTATTEYFHPRLKRHRKVSF